MRIDINPISKGHHFAITTGEYSSYSLTGIYVAKEEIDVERELDAYLAQFITPNAPRIVSPSKFLDWLHGRELIEKVDCFELHLGGYDGDPDDINVSEIDP